MSNFAPRNRLPTLFEVLSRRTLPPVDLFTFYIYMRDQQRSVDYLDFWLDVSQHMSLCRHYVRELRRSVLVSTPDLDKASSKRPSADLLAIARDGSFDEEKGYDDRRLSAFLRSEVTSQYEGRDSLGDQYQNPGQDRSLLSAGNPSTVSGEQHTDSTPSHSVSRSDIRASAEKILYTYLLAGAEREIVLPPNILNRIAQAIEQDGRDDPEVFDEAKDYVFQAMEKDAFPGFLRAKALGNLVPSSGMLRLVVGLLGMFGGFWAAFSLIFLDITPRTTRLWIILPFAIGIYGLFSNQYMLDPILGLLGLSEYQFMKFMKVKEPYVRKLLAKRATWILVLTAFTLAAITCLYVFVPGKRL
ncbi:regulator of G protein signaling superfamily [Ascobolus immersus RN42]|uniref:Regulator of G protein signaling superfamily n=1 Tax=Ascobolus immersus RN42 TaxID=1160509 RepID=A0A3N4ICA6_ASCIM|nr:regulator of G protein signaling superfamily [Ascobolus immersus RN42]